MADENESLYKREEDKKWREHTDRRIVNLTTAQKQAQDDIDELAGNISDFEALLHGARDSRDSGLVGELEGMERTIKSILAILHPDNLGRGGLINDVRELKDLAEKEKRFSDNLWKFWTAIAIAIISSVTLLIREWPNIWEKIHPRPPQVIRKGKVRHIRITAPAYDSNSDSTDSPESPEK